MNADDVEVTVLWKASGILSLGIYDGPITRECIAENILASLQVSDLASLIDAADVVEMHDGSGNDLTVDALTRHGLPYPLAHDLREPPQEADATWTRDDAAMAATEGWDIFDVDHGREWQLQRCDEAGVFEDDDDAWRYVWHKATHAPASTAARGLAFLKRHAPKEYEAIRA